MPTHELDETSNLWINIRTKVLTLFHYWDFNFFNFWPSDLDLSWSFTNLLLKTWMSAPKARRGTTILWIFLYYNSVILIGIIIREDIISVSFWSREFMWKWNPEQKVFWYLELGAVVAKWLSSWLAEQEDRGSIPGLATWILRDW